MSCHKLLQQKGYRLTPQRLMVVDAIHRADSHVSAEEIFAKVRKRYRYANISTVYRTLELLKELGLVVETDLGQGRLSYHHADQGHHHHLVCGGCGAIAEVDESVLDGLHDKLLKDHGFQADIRHLGITGLCRRCRLGQASRGKSKAMGRSRHPQRATSPH